MRTFKKLSDLQIAQIQLVVCQLLHASRDASRSRGVVTTLATFEVLDAYYGEAFGMMRTLEVLGYGEFGSDNIPNSVYARWNLKWWFGQLRARVLEEENYNGNNECEHCLMEYGKDAVRRRVTRDGVDVIIATDPPDLTA